jgi:acetyl esterase/lipase
MKNALAAMVGVLDGAGNPSDPDPVNRIGSKVQSVVATYGAFDLKKIKTVIGGPAVALFVGVRPIADDSPTTTVEYLQYASASPITYITRDDPPFLLFHGDADETVPFEQSQLMEAALQKVSIPVKFVPVPGGRHGRNFQFQPGDSRLPDYIGEAGRWFNSHLREGLH